MIRLLSPSSLAKYSWILPWCLLGVHLSVFWTLFPQYEYGWLVFPLASYFFLRRWHCLPQTTPGQNRGATLVTLSLAFLLLPIWWIRVATPDWSVISIVLAVAVSGFTLALLAQRGGWIAARHLAFPILFMFCAVPWPPRLEEPLTQGLMRTIAAVTVEGLQWLGISAIRNGNLVALSNGTIDIAEACSGIRSLQSMLMASLALGEVRRMRTRPRLLLVAAGLGLALSFNFLRNFSLALLAHFQGIGAIAKWHDAGGWSILIISFLFLMRFAGRFETLGEPAHHGPPKLRPFPAWAGMPLALWFIAIIAGNEWWYRRHETNAVKKIEIEWPLAKPDFHINPIASRTQEILRCSSGKIVSWNEAGGIQFAFAALRWDPGRTSSQSARVHSPEICLPAAGKKWVRSYPSATLPIRGGELVFSASQFDFAGHPVYVFFTLYEEQNKEQENGWLLQDWSQWSRIQRAMIGKRNSGQQSLEIAVSGLATFEEALQAVSGQLPILARFE